jgi:DNA-binding CsgD family transcriptional regulator
MNIALMLGDASVLSGDLSTARVHFERGLQWATRLRHRPEIARARLALGELLLDDAKAARFSPAERAHRRAEACIHLDFAIEELRTMKMQPFLADALRLRNGQRTGAPVPAEVRDGAGLSRRELDVLTLMAAGKTNPEIGDTLAISVNTVARHVSRIFTKIGVANRTQAAAWVFRGNLLERD